MKVGKRFISPKTKPLMDASTQKTFLDTFSPLLLSLCLTGTFGLLTGIYLERIRNKTLILTHTIDFQSLGTTIKDKFWGNIEIAHNGREIKHLNLVTVTIENNTRADAQYPLVFETWLDNRSQFLGHNGFYDTGNSIAFEDIFAQHYNKLIEDLDENILLQQNEENHITPPELDRRLSYIQNNRKLALPIFNRKSFVKISFLIENFDGVVPKIYMSILQKGIKFIPQGDKIKTEKTKKIAVSLVTLLTYIVGLIWVFSHYKGKEDAVISTILIGSTSYLLGFGIYYLFVYLKKFFW